jgi:hypothetical protein
VRGELKRALEREVPDLEEVTGRLVSERLAEATRKFEYEREQMIRDLQNRVEKVLRLEMELDEVKDAYRTLESSLSRDEQ